KYRLVYEAVVGDGSPLTGDQRPVPVEPQPASWDELALVHTPEYLAKMRVGTMTPEDIAQLELPWSQEMVDGFRVMVGGTIDAACLACGVARHDDRTQRPPSTQRILNSAISASSAFSVVGHIGGGLHHAFPNQGEGLCPF